MGTIGEIRQLGAFVWQSFLLPAIVLSQAACSAEPETKVDDPVLFAPEHGPVPPLPESTDDPWTPQQIELGRAIFYDFRLSGSGQTNCDRCHIAATSFQDSLGTPVPDSSFPEAQPHLARNTSSMLNLVYAPVARWDGSHTDLVEVMVFPFAEGNMDLGATVAEAQSALKARFTDVAPGYIPLFAGAFDEDIVALDPPSVWRLTGRALLAFITLAVSRDAAFDRWNAGDDSAMSEGAVRGFEIFRGRGRCNACHSGPLFTDFSFHNVSTSPPSPSGERADDGRFVVTGNEDEKGAFLTPTLRSAFATGPYFHDGQAGTLRNAIRHFAGDTVLADPLHDLIFDSPPDLSETDIDDLIEFFRALRGQPIGEEVGPPEKMP